MEFKDAHDRDSSLLNAKIGRLIEQNRLKRRSQALIFLFLCQKFMAEDDQIEDSFKDGGNDLGIDAVFIEHKAEDPVIHVIQSKCYESERKSRNPFKYSELDKISRFFDILRDRSVSIDKVANYKLEQKIHEIRDLEERFFPEFRIWLMSNGTPPCEHETMSTISRLETRERKIRNFHLTDFVDLCIERRNVQETRIFHAREDGIVRIDKFGISGAIGLISAQELFHLVRDRADHSKIEPSIFDVNVRGFLGFKGDINKEIFKSATSTSNRLFWALNNGITLVATSGKINDQSDRPKIKVKNLNIVNGAQTCSAIFNAMKEYHPNFEIFRELSVPFRLFYTDEPELIEKISISTNSQNRINARDLKANDEIQKRIEKELHSLGVGYIRKRGQILSDKNLTPLDAMKAGQIILSYQLHEPDRAKRESDHIFAKEYQRIFGKFDANKMLRGLTLYNRILAVRDRIEDDIRIKGSHRVENDFVTYGTFHLLALSSIFEERNNLLADDQLIEASIKVIAKTLAKRNYPAFYKFFRDPTVTAELMLLPSQGDLFE